MTKLFDWKTGAFAVAALALCGAAEYGQVMYAQRDNLQVLDAPDIAGVPLEIVAANAAVTVISENGRWIQVQAPGGNAGWVLSSALAAEQASGEGGLSSVLALANPTLDTAAAGRGVVSNGARQYATSKNYDPTLLEQVFEARIRARGQWRAFVNDSGLAGATATPQEAQQ